MGRRGQAELVKGVVGIQAGVSGASDSDGGPGGTEGEDLRHVFLGTICETWGSAGYVHVGRSEGAVGCGEGGKLPSQIHKGACTRPLGSKSSLRALFV